MGGSRGYNSEVRTTQLQVFVIPFNVPSDGVMLSTSEGNGDLTVVRNGTGDYTLTLRNPAARAVCVSSPCPAVANLQCQRVSVSASAVRFKFTDNSGTATDTEFSGAIFGSDDLALRG